MVSVSLFKSGQTLSPEEGEHSDGPEKRPAHRPWNGEPADESREGRTLEEILCPTSGPAGTVHGNSSPVPFRSSPPWGEGPRAFLHQCAVSGLSPTQSPAGADEDQGTPRSPRTGAVPGIFHRLGEPTRQGSRVLSHHWAVSGPSLTQSPAGASEDRGPRDLPALEQCPESFNLWVSRPGKVPWCSSIGGLSAVCPSHRAQPGPTRIREPPDLRAPEQCPESFTLWVSRPGKIPGCSSIGGLSAVCPPHVAQLGSARIGVQVISARGCSEFRSSSSG